jgi:hypothetical protein
LGESGAGGAAQPARRQAADNERVYKRRALTLHALRKRIVDQAFDEMLQDLTDRHTYATVITGQFLAVARSYGG